MHIVEPFVGGEHPPLLSYLPRIPRRIFLHTIYTTGSQGTSPRRGFYSITTIWWPSTDGTTIRTLSPSEVKGTCVMDGAQ